jgi:hypothetical protein
MEGHDMVEPEQTPAKARLSSRPRDLQPKRIREFAVYFKNYMGVSSLVTAALPIPVTLWHLIPTYDAQRRFLSVYTSLFCFLLLGYVFFVRDRLAGALLRERPEGTLGSWRFIYVPALLILGCLIMVVCYHGVLNWSVTELASKNDSTAAILRDTDVRLIPLGTPLMLIYLAIFLSAEGAFILMATKEYLQDIAGISDAKLLEGPLAPRRWCILRVNSDTNASGAKVLVDGKEQGEIPCSLELRSGDHSIAAEKIGHRLWERKITIPPTDAVFNVEVEMEVISP